MQQQDYDANVIAEVAGRLHVAEYFVQVALRSWDRPTNANRADPGTIGSGRSWYNAVWFFSVPLLHKMPGNLYREGNRERIIKKLEKKGRLEQPDESGETPQLKLYYNVDDREEIDGDDNGSVWGLVFQGNHRINSFAYKGYAWFPVGVTGHKDIGQWIRPLTLEGGIDDRSVPGNKEKISVRKIPYSTARWHKPYYVPTNVDPRFTIQDTTQVAGAALLNIRVFYNRVASEGALPKRMPGKKKKKKKQKPRKRRMSPRRSSDDDRSDEEEEESRSRKQRKSERRAGTRDDPFVLGQCVVCDWPLLLPLTCKTCDSALYCGDGCRNEHWEAGHDEVCENTRLEEDYVPHPEEDPDRECE